MLTQMLPCSLLMFHQLETKFRDHTNKTMTERDEAFRCVVKFASTNLLESLRHSASSGTQKVLKTVIRVTIIVSCKEVSYVTITWYITKSCRILTASLQVSIRGHPSPGRNSHIVMLLH